MRAHWALAVSAGLGLAGLAAVLAVYLDLASRLPSELPDHFGPTGHPNGTLPPGTFLTVVLGVIVATSVLFFFAVWGAIRSPALRSHHQKTLVTPILVIQGTMVAVVLPTIAIAVMASAAGVWGISGQGLGLTTLVLGVVPVVALLIILLTYGRVGLPKVPADPSGPAPAFLGVGGGVVFNCSACGQEFQLSGVPLFAPHMALGGKGSIYLRCPKCGERGWDPIVGKVNS